MARLGELSNPEPSNGTSLKLEQVLTALSRDATLRREPTSHIHKNDVDYGSVLHGITETSVVTDKTRVGLIVGNGAFLSSLPNIPAEVIITVDYNPFIPEWSRFTAQAFLKTETPAEYQALVYGDQNHLYRELRTKGLSPKKRLAVEMEDLGELHFLSSQERFTLCKKALQRKKIINSAVDLTNKTALETVAQALSQENAEITFANMTNVWEHSREYAGQKLIEESLPALPFHSQAIILQSSYAYTTQWFPRMMDISRGLPHYMNAAHKAYDDLRKRGKM